MLGVLRDHANIVLRRVWIIQISLKKVHFSATALAVTRPAQDTFAVIKWNLQSSVIRKEYT